MSLGTWGAATWTYASCPYAWDGTYTAPIPPHPQRTIVAEVWDRMIIASQENTNG